MAADGTTHAQELEKQDRKDGNAIVLESVKNAKKNQNAE
jgi:hypothetical protein